MAIALEYNKEKKILYATIIGKLTLNEFTDTLDEIIRSHYYSPDIGILLDASSVNTSIGNNQCELNMIEIQKRFPEEGKAKIAIITSSDFTFGMRRMHEMLSDAWPQNIIVLSNFTEAEQWLETGK